MTPGACPRCSCRIVSSPSGRFADCDSYKLCISCAEMPRIVEQENRIGTLSDESFEPLSNFTIQYDVEVRAGEDSGFMVEVIQYDGTSLG